MTDVRRYRWEGIRSVCSNEDVNRDAVLRSRKRVRCLSHLVVSVVYEHSDGTTASQHRKPVRHAPVDDDGGRRSSRGNAGRRDEQENERCLDAAKTTR